MAERQKNLAGGYALTKQQLERRARYAEITYKRRGEDYEEVFRDLMRYGVIDPKKIENVEDFRDIVNHTRRDGAQVISETLVDALERTMEYKEMLIEKIRYAEVKLKSGKSSKGLPTEDNEAYMQFDRFGHFHVRSRATGRFIKSPAYYGLLPIDEIIV